MIDLPDIGPLGGLEAALRQTRRIFGHAGRGHAGNDGQTFYGDLLEQSGPAGIVPHLEGFYCGAAAVYPVKILPLVEEILAGNDRSFQHLIRRSSAFRVDEGKGNRPVAQRALLKTGTRRRICSEPNRSVADDLCPRLLPLRAPRNQQSVSRVFKSPQPHRTSLVGGLARVGIEGRKCQPVHFVIVHRDEELTRSGSSASQTPSPESRRGEKKF